MAGLCPAFLQRPQRHCDLVLKKKKGPTENRGP